MSNLDDVQYDMTQIEGNNDLTVDQAIELAKVKAIAALAQQLNHLSHRGINPHFDDSF